MRNQSFDSKRNVQDIPAKAQRRLRGVFSYPENLLEDLLRSRSLSRGLEALGYPDFLVKLYKRALRSRSVEV